MKCPVRTPSSMLRPARLVAIRPSSAVCTTSLARLVRGGQGLNGPVEHWIETLTEWATDLGLDTFVFWPEDATQEQVRLFAEEVVPGGARRSQCDAHHHSRHLLISGASRSQ